MNVGNKFHVSRDILIYIYYETIDELNERYNKVDVISKSFEEY